MPACLPALPAPQLLNTSPALVPLPGPHRDLKGSFQTWAFWLWPHRQSPCRGAEVTQVGDSVSNGGSASLCCLCLAKRSASAVFKTLEHSFSTIAFSSSLMASPPPDTQHTFVAPCFCPWCLLQSHCHHNFCSENPTII